MMRLNTEVPYLIQHLSLSDWDNIFSSYSMLQVRMMMRELEKGLNFPCLHLDHSEYFSLLILQYYGLWIV